MELDLALVDLDVDEQTLDGHQVQCMKHHPQCAAWDLWQGARVTGGEDVHDGGPKVDRVSDGVVVDDPTVHETVLTDPHGREDTGNGCTCEDRVHGIATRHQNRAAVDHVRRHDEERA